MLDTLILVVAAIIGLSLLLNRWRFTVGPHMIVRVIALNTMCINAIALIVILGIFMQSPPYYEGALIIATLGFVSTTAVSKFILGGDIID